MTTETKSQLDKALELIHSPNMQLGLDTMRSILVDMNPQERRDFLVYHLDFTTWWNFKALHEETIEEIERMKTNHEDFR